MDDLPEGAVDLVALEAAGIVEIHAPGSPEEAAFHQDMLAQLADVDADLLARDGPDAMTSDRMLRQAALRAEHDPSFVGHALAAWCRSRGWERSDLADWLGISTTALAALALEHIADPGYPFDAGVPQRNLSERYGIDARRLTQVLSEARR
jgi:hypothetical protein